MEWLAKLLIAVVAILHVYFLVLEMFLWTKLKGLQVFRQTLEQAKASAVLASNQGLYNGFLAAGLVWGLVNPHAEFSRQILFFFLGCVIVAGVYGAATANRRIFFIQALPALFAAGSLAIV
ncbi:MAG: DUF1304 domain-containing protein [Bacteriovoracia bacterium]